jgi:uncharacterized protein YuzE
MKVIYDEEADAIYLRLKETSYYESDEIKEGLILDYDEKGNLIGIEILDVSEYLSPEELATLSFNIERALAK